MYLIAEIGQAHDGSLGMAHSFIDALANTGVHAVKFQMHIAEAESSQHEPFRVNFSYEDKNRYDYWQRMEFTFEQWQGIAAHCKECGLEFLASPFSIEAVNRLDQLGVTQFKIGSGEVNNFLLLESIAKTQKHIILSSGMSSFAELDKTVAFLKSRGATYSMLQCTTSYPTKPDVWGLNVIGELKERYKVPVGFSDHSGDIFACLAATALGAEILEFHVTFDKQMFGPDATSSLNLAEVARLAEGVKQIDTALANPIDKSDNSDYNHLKGMFEKSLAINKDLPAGHVLTLADLESKKPKGYGMNAALFEIVLGKSLKANMAKWDFLNEDDLQ